jgi:hypothetical protein
MRLVEQSTRERADSISLKLSLEGHFIRRRENLFRLRRFQKAGALFDNLERVVGLFFFVRRSKKLSNLFSELF